MKALGAGLKRGQGHARLIDKEGEEETAAASIHPHLSGSACGVHVFRDVRDVLGQGREERASPGHAEVLRGRAGRGLGPQMLRG